MGIDFGALFWMGIAVGLTAGVVLGALFPWLWLWAVAAGFVAALVTAYCLVVTHGE